MSRWEEPGIRWFWFHFGRAWYADIWREMSLGLLGRRDLMTRPDDEGRYILAVLAVTVIFGPTSEAIEDYGFWSAPWRFRVHWRSDAAEIAQRLARRSQ